MNTKIGWVIVITLAVAIVVAGIFVWRAPSANNVPEGDTAKEAPKIAGATHKILVKSNGFVPKELTIKAGDEVIFTNEDADKHWPASDIHPTHTLCPGFDALRPMGKGESYSHVFEKAGTCPMHDHIMPSMRGKIIVK